MMIARIILIKLNGLFRTYLFSKRRFIRFLFDVDVVVPSNIQSYCEWGTILQRFIMHRYIRPGARILEIGTGAHAILAIFAKKCYPEASVLATDILTERISFARKTAAANRVDVTFKGTDMFKGIEGRFDLILFNPPAIPSSDLEKLGFELKSYPSLGVRRCWSGDGGPDGLDVIRAFLNGLKEYLTVQGHAIISVNPIHFGVNHLGSLFQNAALTIERVHRFPGITNAYILTARKHQNKRSHQKNEAPSL